MADTARIEELRRRVQTDPASIAFAALAEEYRRAGHFDDAIATCRTGLQRHPAYLSARVTLGRSLLEIGHYEEARQELEQVLRSAPENLAAIRALAEIHHRAGELPESEHHFQETEAQPAADAPAPQASPAATASSIPLSVVPAASATPPSVADAATPSLTVAAAPIQLQAAVPLAPSPATPAAPPPVTVSPAVPAAPIAAAPPSRQESAPRTATSAAAVALAPVPVPRASHPDEVALPALEAFLSAIVAARASGNRVAR